MGGATSSGGTATSGGTTGAGGTASTGGTLTVSTTGLDFGEVVIGSTATSNLTLTNLGGTGSQPVTITLSGPNLTDFAYTSCPSSLAPGDMCVITVRAQPSQVGSRSASLSIAGVPTPVEMAATGVYSAALLLDPSSYTFPDAVRVGTVSPATAFTISNLNGSQTTGSLAISISGQNSYAFVLDPSGCSNGCRQRPARAEPLTKSSPVLLSVHSQNKAVFWASGNPPDPRLHELDGVGAVWRGSSCRRFRGLMSEVDPDLPEPLAKSSPVLLDRRRPGAKQRSGMRS